jgi:hypothetical protein
MQCTPLPADANPEMRFSPFMQMYLTGGPLIWVLDSGSPPLFSVIATQITDCYWSEESFLTLIGFHYRYTLYTVKKANIFSSYHENIRFWAGKTPFPWQEYFSHGPQCVLFNAWNGIMFPFVKRKTAGDIIYPQCFFQSSRVEKYSLLGRRRTRKTYGMRKETERTPSPPTSV